MSDATSNMLDEIRRLMSGHTDRKEEARILEILERTDADQLNDLLQELDLSRLISDIDDRLFGPDNRTALLELLTDNRVNDLEAESRAAIVSALQKGRTGKLDEKGIRNILVNSQGAGLTELKNEIDAGGDYRDLQQLLFTDIDSADIREEILDHIQREGAAMGRLSTLKALSDIDDTLYANLKDGRYPKRTTYPGVIQYYDELVRGPSEQREVRGNLVFLTARPKVRTGHIERLTIRSLRKRGVREATILSGDFLHLLGNDLIAERKYENFVQYQKLFPEYGFVFTGDSGQGDAIFGAKIRADFGDAVRGVFIHDVIDTPQQERDEWRSKGVVFFDTYIGAATAAFESRLISNEGLARVLVKAQEEFARTDFRDPQRQSGDEDRARQLLAQGATA